jgi:hypothetical protein
VGARSRAGGGGAGQAAAGARHVGQTGRLASIKPGRACRNRQRQAGAGLAWRTKRGFS